MVQFDEQYINSLTDIFSFFNKGEIIQECKNDIIGAIEDDNPFRLEIFRFVRNFCEAQKFVRALSEGKLDIEPPAKNLLVSSYKMLQSNLKHLTWQAQQVAKGDLSQEVHFLGDFSDAFNSMIESLREKRKMEKALEESEKSLRELNATKDKFFSIIAHDLKGPLSATNSLFELLKTEYTNLSETEKIEFIDLGYGSLKNILSLLLNLLDWSRLQMGQIQFSPRVFSVIDIINSNIKVLSLNAGKKEIKISTDCPENILVSADYNMILTVVRNLVSNAIKFTPVGGSIIIGAYKVGDNALISVADNGIGMKNEDVEKLFRLDVHFTNPGTEAESGTGLGLIMCKEFVEKNCGRIWAESELGKGSTFLFTIPIKK